MDSFEAAIRTARTRQPVATPAPRPEIRGGKAIARLSSVFYERDRAGNLKNPLNDGDRVAAASQADIDTAVRTGDALGIHGLGEMTAQEIEDLAASLPDGAGFMERIGRPLLHSRANLELGKKMAENQARRRKEAVDSSKEILGKVADVEAAKRRRWASYSDEQLDAHAATVPRNPSLTRDEKLRELDAVRAEFSARHHDRSRPTVVGQGKR